MRSQESFSDKDRFRVLVRRPTESESFDAAHADHLEHQSGKSESSKKYDHDKYFIIKFIDAKSCIRISTHEWEPSDPMNRKNGEFTSGQKTLANKILRRFDATQFHNSFLSSMHFPEDYPQQVDLSNKKRLVKDAENYYSEEINSPIIGKVVYYPSSNLMILYGNRTRAPDKFLFALGVPRGTSGATLSTTQFGSRGQFLDNTNTAGTKLKKMQLIELQDLKMECTLDEFRQIQEINQADKISEANTNA